MNHAGHVRGPLAGWLVWAALPFTAAGGEHVSGVAPGFSLAVSETVAGELNGNDASAGMKAWADVVARQTDLRVEPELCTSAELLRKVRNRQVDAFSINILEFVRVARYVDPTLVIEESDATGGQEYLLLVHQASGIRSLADLRGRSLVLYQNKRTCLGRIWLDTLLASAHLGAAATFLGRVDSSPKLSHVVLPVFFRQTDACLVTRPGYATMCELNPQLAKQLRILAESPKLVTTLLAFDRDSSPETRRKFRVAITELHNSVVGRQALMLFGTAHLVPADISALHTSLELLHAYERLPGKAPLDGQ